MTELNFEEMWKERQLESFDGEIWKPCTESDYYEISNYGRVKQIGTMTKSKHPIPRITPQRLDGKGYCSCSLITTNSKRSNGFKVHRLVGFCFIQNPNNLEQINHINGKKTFNKVDNLEWISNLDNMRHSYEIGLREFSSRGEMNGRSVLNEENVRDIYENKEYKTIKELCEIYGTERSTIQAIMDDKHWTYVTKNLNKAPVSIYDVYSKCYNENETIVFKTRKDLLEKLNCSKTRIKDRNTKKFINGYWVEFITAKEYYEILYNK